jgi:hypothetical protein
MKKLNQENSLKFSCLPPLFPSYLFCTSPLFRYLESSTLDIGMLENYIYFYGVTILQQEESIMMYTLAHLEKDKLADIQSLEKTLGKTLVAFAPKDVKFIPLKDDEISRIQQVEKKLNISLVAVK